MIQIVPTILVKTFEEFTETLGKIEDDFPLAQLDVMDGRFVPNTTFADFEKINRLNTPIKYELHLMVEEPMKYIEDAKTCKNVKKVIFHYETKKDVNETVRRIRECGWEAGLAFNPDTAVEDVASYLDILDCVMVMGVMPGFSGQIFMPDTVQRVKELRERSSKIDIEVDGGVTAQSARALAEAGANILAVNTFLYKGNPAEQKNRLLQLIKNSR